MKFHTMADADRTKGLCWKYALACILNISPKRVPNFVRADSPDDAGRTRKWLKKNFNKSMVYVPIHCFLETCTERDNPCNGPDGYSILILSTHDEGEQHAVIAKDGKFIHDPNDLEGRERLFKHIVGYCIIYDL